MGLAHKTEQRSYRKIYKEHYGSIPKGYHIHHIDFNPYNHDPKNLVALTPEQHAKVHNHEGVKWATEAGKKGGRVRMQNVTREWHSKGGKASKNPGGYFMSEQGKKNIKEARLNTKKIECPKCGFKTDPGNMTRHIPACQ